MEEMRPDEKFQMQQDLIFTALTQFNTFDIRRRSATTDSVLGGVTVTSTAIDTRVMELQHLDGREATELGGLRIEAQYRGFTHENVNLREGDILTPDSGTNKFEVVFVQNMHGEHTEFFAKKVD